MSILFSSRPRRIAFLCLAVLLLAVAVYEMMPAQRLKARQEALVEWARDGAPGDFAEDFAAADYHDQWGHRAGDVAERVRTARFFNPRIAIEAGRPEISRSGDTATIIQEITVRQGDGETLRQDFHFTWRKESFWPWSWKLRAVEAPGFQY